MSTHTSRHTPSRGRAVRLITTAAAAALGVGALTALPAAAGPGGVEGPDCFNDSMPGSVVFTSSTNVAKGQQIFFAGQDFPSGTGGVYQALNMKLDAAGPGGGQYDGEASAELGDGIIDTVQVQADGFVSGSFVVPNDLDDESANPMNAAGPHYMRLLGSAPGTSCYTDDFDLDAAAAVAPDVTATAVTSSGRGGSSVTVTVEGSGFAADELVQVRRVTGTSTTEDLQWTLGSGGSATTEDEIAADAEGNLEGRIVLPLGELTAGEHQLLFPRPANAETPAAAQVVVDPITSVSGLAQGSEGTFTLSNVPGGTTVTAVLVDEDGDVNTTDDQSSILPAPLTVPAEETSASAPVLVPETHPVGAGQAVFVQQSAPFAKAYQTSAKVSPSSSPLNEDRFVRVETGEGDIKEGLYQSAYSETEDALFVTTAYRTSGVIGDATDGWDGTLYKLDPDTLEVLDTVRPPFVEGEAGARYATYGVGVDEENNTVWITNTRQNTVAVYDGATLDLVKQFPSDIVNHTRDVIIDEATNKAFVTAAQRGGDEPAVIGVFDTETLTQLPDIEVGDNPDDFVPMSLELDEANGKLYTVSLSTSEAVEVDTTTGAVREIAFDTEVTSASGVAYDDGKLYVASQGTDNMLIVDVATGDTIEEVPTGAGSLNVAIAGDLVYVSNFGGATVSVHSLEGEVLARLTHVRPNHVHEGPDGSIYSVNKDSGNTVVKFSVKQPDPAPKNLKATKPKLKGQAVVGKKLTVVTKGWTKGTKFTVRWVANGKKVGQGKSLKLKKKHQGKKVKAVVTGKKSGYKPKTKSSKGVKVKAKKKKK